MAHIPVLIKEVLEYLDLKPNQNFIDATVGDGGHAAAILEKTSPNGKLLAIDRDSDSIVRAKSKLMEFGNRVLYINDSFGNLASIVKENNGLANGILFDFGMSSSQLENSGRGFTFSKDEILDMRYDVKTPITAEDVVNEYSEKELVEIFKKWADVPNAIKIARAIIQDRRKERIKTTGELVKIIDKTIKRRGRLHPATLVFQALRIEVNQELAEIEKALKIIPEILKQGSRSALISFHSLEDRLIKNWSKNLEKQGIIKILNKKPITTSLEEIRINPRSRSAKLRVVEKT
ncbi:MAG: 16S rRNA (cytosine(1402)-N(4))-methyltransferase RsmH [Parcubacteria group bacterium]|nr:16S rRNA (cytosine(1402)-N(4))-methyltransferase RsmH [Parcubacteria group bacterium]